MTATTPSIKNLRQRLKRSEWLTTCYHEASHAVAALHLDQHFDCIAVHPYNNTRGGMVAYEADDPKVDAIISLLGCVFEHWLSPSIPVDSGEEDEDWNSDWNNALSCGWRLGLVDDERSGGGNQMDDAVRQRLLPEAEQLFQEHFDDIVTLGEALRKKGRGGRMSETECRATVNRKAAAILLPSTVLGNN